MLCTSKNIVLTCCGVMLIAYSPAVQSKLRGVERVGASKKGRARAKERASSRTCGLKATPLSPTNAQEKEAASKKREA